MAKYTIVADDRAVHSSELAFMEGSGVHWTVPLASAGKAVDLRRAAM